MGQSETSELTGLSMAVTMSSRPHVFHNRLPDIASLDLERGVCATVRRHSILRCLGKTRDPRQHLPPAHYARKNHGGRETESRGGYPLSP
jgi:hypothetical protein